MLAERVVIAIYLGSPALPQRERDLWCKRYLGGQQRQSDSDTIKLYQ